MAVCEQAYATLSQPRLQIAIIYKTALITQSSQTIIDTKGMEGQWRSYCAKRSRARFRSSPLNSDWGHAIVQRDGGDKEWDGKRPSFRVQGGSLRDKDIEKVFVGGNLIFVIVCILFLCYCQ